MAPAAFQQVGEAHQVGLDVRRGVFERIAHARLRGEVQHGLRFYPFKNGGERRRVGNVDLAEIDPELLQPVALELHRVVRREIVDADDLVAARRQALGAVHADEAGDPCDQHLHCRSAL